MQKTTLELSLQIYTQQLLTLGCRITYQDDKEIESKITLFQLLCGCIIKHIKKTRKEEQLKYYNVMAIPQLLYGSETWIRKAKGISRIQGAELKLLRAVKGRCV